jgi:large subunit ribosomal protein L7/L12
MGIFGSPQEQVDFEDLKARVAKLEAAVALLQGQVATASATAVGGIPYGAAQPAVPSLGALPAEGAWLSEVRALKESDQKIQAIKLYREKTGLGLKEAKDAVEGMI